ncbi:MAG: hypothetical protein CMJ69_19950, partial [Planctomycetaceae bacterium]|nr:hypothetical protein [Planctomycetaceae bacterium]
MSLSEHFEDRFRGDIRFRGSEFLRAELIRVTEVTPTNLTAVIQDDTEFEAELSHSDGGLQLFCSCSKKDDRSATCRHLWAAILVIDRDGYLAGTTTPDYVPPFTSDSSRATGDHRGPLLEDMAEDDDDFADFLSRSSGRRTWETRLSNLGDTLENGSVEQDSERDIVYEIDMAQSRAENQIVLQTSQRQRRANGQWGKWKPLRIRGGRVDAISDPDDREFLTLLSGGIPTESSNGTRATAAGPSTFRYRVPGALAAMLIPRLCEMQRLTFLDPDGPDELRLQWDDGPAWDFRLAVNHDSDASLWRLTGRFHRAEEERDLADTQLVLASGFYFTNSTAHRHAGTVAAAWSRMLVGDMPFSVPNGDEKDLVAMLLELPDLPDLDLPEPLALDTIDVTPDPVLSLTVPRGRRWNRERLAATLHFNYAGTLLSAHNSQSAIVLKDQRRCARRDTTRESAAWQELADAGFERIDEHRRGQRQLDISIGHLTPAIRMLMSAGWQVQSDGMPVRQAGEFQMSVRSHIDWF